MSSEMKSFLLADINSFINFMCAENLTGSNSCGAPDGAYANSGGFRGVFSFKEALSLSLRHPCIGFACAHPLRVHILRFS